jgi:hypothetical protein
MPVNRCVRKKQLQEGERDVVEVESRGSFPRKLSLVGSKEKQPFRHFEFIGKLRRTMPQSVPKPPRTIRPVEKSK